MKHISVCLSFLLSRNCEQPRASTPSPPLVLDLRGLSSPLAECGPYSQLQSVQDSRVGSPRGRDSGFTCFDVLVFIDVSALWNVTSLNGCGQATLVKQGQCEKRPSESLWSASSDHVGDVGRSAARQRLHSCSHCLGLTTIINCLSERCHGWSWVKCPSAILLHKVVFSSLRTHMHIYKNSTAWLVCMCVVGC